MKCTVLHESSGRLRIRCVPGGMTMEQADLLTGALSSLRGVRAVKVYDRTGDAVITYTTGREDVLRTLAGFSFAAAKAAGLAPAHSSRALNRAYEEKLVGQVARRAFSKLFLPAPVRAVITAVRSVRYLRAGVAALFGGHLTVPVLDATAIGVSLLRRDFGTAGSVMFLLGVGETLEEWTHKKSVADLAGAMSLHVDRVWKKTDAGEVLVDIGEVAVGDLLVVRTGHMIPLDGRVAEGQITVNQSSMTGESAPVPKGEGDPVYAGCAVEEGSCVIRVEHTAGGGRYDRIVRMIEESEKLKSAAEDKASRLADKLVPLTFAGTALTWLLTRNVTKTLACLMVDFSCAMKLSMPLAVLSAMRECSHRQVSVKGGRFLEAVAAADTIVFDKTGTLTRATPTVMDVVTFGRHDAEEMLRLAACLEEHYPHSIANAVVEEARRRGLSHEEYHSRVEYVVAHGISSTVNGKKVLIGSAHFVFEDEGVKLPRGAEKKFAALPPEYSHLYLSIGGTLAAVLCIADPLRPEARDAVRALHACGIRHVVMMTGDNKDTAAAVAATVGVDEYYAEVLPEDKANYIKKARAAGHTVIMVGDGVNDSPALSEADVGIAISTGAAIAREIADITVSSEDLRALVTLRRLATSLMARIRHNYRFILSFNFGLIALGVAGVIPPTTSALLHNLSTLGISLKSMTDLLPAPGEQP